MEIGLVQHIDVDVEMQQSYLDYAMSVIVSRALPDARDGLKPVHRRTLHAMQTMGLRSDTPFRKSARIVGEVLGKFHPHGDMAVYDAMARMAQTFSMRHPLVEGQGNFGSIDGDPPAAMRYTEARMSPLAMELLADLEKETVDFVPNFDGSLTEPTVLPAAFPNLLVNGATGIAVGMATSVPPHNLGEVCDALIFMLQNWTRLEKVGLDDLMQFIQGPDFPTGGLLLRWEGEGDTLKTAYASGKGKLSLQARTHTEELSRGRSRIIVTELPFQTNKSGLIQRIADLARQGTLEGLADLRDESDRQGMRIVIELSKAADPQKVLAELYRRTPMQSTFSVIMLALVDGEPRLLTLKGALRVYLEHRLEVVRRRNQFELERARQRAHVLEGLRIAIQNLDAVIQMIRSAKDVEQAQARLQRRLRLTELQARAILDMRLRRLSALERKKLDEEYRETLDTIRQLEALLRSTKKMRQSIADELTAIKANYADRRRTQIVVATPGQMTGELLSVSDLAPARQTWVVVTEDGKVSRTTTDRPPRLSGRKPPRLVVGASARDTLYLLTSDGLAAAVAVGILPECEDPQLGPPMHAVIPLPEGAELAAGIALPPDKVGERAKGGCLVTVTLDGMVKRSELATLPGPSAKSFQAVKVGEHDRLGWVKVTSGDDDIVLVNSLGFAIRFPEEDVRSMGLAASGVLGMRMEAPQARLIGADLVRPRAELFILARDGRAKRVALNQFPKQGRYGKGVLTWKSGDEVVLVGAAVGQPGDRATAVMEHAAARAVRFGEAPRRSRLAVGQPLIEVKAGDQVAELRTLLPSPSFAQSEPRAKGRKESPIPTAESRSAPPAEPSDELEAEEPPTEPSPDQESTNGVP